MRGAWLMMSALTLGLGACLLVTDFEVRALGAGGTASAGGGGEAGAGGDGGGGAGGELADCAEQPCRLADGGACPEVIANSSAGSVAADADSFYTADHTNSQLRRFPRKGCEGSTFSLPATLVDVVALLDGALYWNTRNDPPELERCQISDCAATREIVLTGDVDDGFNALVTSDGKLLMNRVAGQVASLDPNNGDAYEVLSSDPLFGAPGLQTLGLRRVGDELFWTRFKYDSPSDACAAGGGGGAGGAGGGAIYSDCTGALVRAPLDGGVATDVVTGLRYPSSYAIDDDWVYHRAVAGDALLERSAREGKELEKLPLAPSASPPLGEFGGLGPAIVRHGDWIYFWGRQLDVMNGGQPAPILLRVRSDDFSPSGLEVVITPSQLGLGLGDTYVPGPYIEGTTEHAVYWTAGSTFWGATVPP